MNEVDLALHCEMFSCLDDGITTEPELIEILSQVLVDQFNWDYPEAEVYADVFVIDNYANISAEVKECQDIVAEDYKEKWHDYMTSVGALA